MTTKIIKKLKIAAATVFVLGLAINVYMTLNQPFSTVDTVLIAQQTGTGGTDGDDNNNNNKGWIRIDEDCVYTITGEVGSKVKIFGVQVITIGADGMATYTYPGGRTHCIAGGNAQCKARYCPSLISLGTGTKN